MDGSFCHKKLQKSQNKVNKGSNIFSKLLRCCLFPKDFVIPGIFLFACLLFLVHHHPTVHRHPWALYWRVVLLSPEAAEGPRAEPFRTTLNPPNGGPFTLHTANDWQCGQTLLPPPRKSNPNFRAITDLVCT